MVDCSVVVESAVVAGAAAAVVEEVSSSGAADDDEVEEEESPESAATAEPTPTAGSPELEPDEEDEADGEAADEDSEDESESELSLSRKAGWSDRRKREPIISGVTEGLVVDEAGDAEAEEAELEGTLETVQACSFLPPPVLVSFYTYTGYVYYWIVHWEGLQVSEGYPGQATSHCSSAVFWPASGSCREQAHSAPLLVAATGRPCEAQRVWQEDWERYLEVGRTRASKPGVL